MKYLKWYTELIEKASTQIINEDIYTEIHHIVPKHCDGDDNTSNLIKLTFRQHTLAHLLLWKIYGRHEDLCAYKFMSGISTSEKKVLYSTLGGKVQGNRNVKSGHMEKIRKMVDMTANGKRSAEICRRLEVNAFFDPKIRIKSASLGGKVQGKINASNGHLKRIANLPRKRKRGDMIWITDNNETKWHDAKKSIPKGWKRGRTL